MRGGDSRAALRSTMKFSSKAFWQKSARRLEMPSPACCQKVFAVGQSSLG
jgi:hypothetical protein